MIGDMKRVTKALDNDIRHKIVAFMFKYPGWHFTIHLRDKFDMPMSTLMMHMYYLKKWGMVICKRDKMAHSFRINLDDSKNKKILGLIFR